MSIDTPYVPASYGALDSNAVGVGNPLNAHLLRALVGSANRLQAKPQQLFSMQWPAIVLDSADLTAAGVGTVQQSYAFSANATPTWFRVIPAFSIPKKPGLSRMDVRLRVSLTTGLRVAFQVQTIESPFAPNLDSSDPSVLIAAGLNDDLATHVIPDIPISRGRQETVSLWVRTADITLPLGNETTYGAPNSGSITEVGENFVARTTAQLGTTFDWGAGTRTNVTFADAGHVVRLIDAEGITVATRELIALDVYGGNDGDTGRLTGRLTFAPNISADQIKRMSGPSTAERGTWEIRELAKYALTGFAGAATERVT